MKTTIKKSLLAISCLIVMSVFSLPFIPDEYSPHGGGLGVLYGVSLIPAYLTLVIHVIKHVLKDPDLDNGTRLFWLLASLTGGWACVYYLLYYRYPEKPATASDAPEAQPTIERANHVDPAQ